jgi:hypothetical protein
LRTTVSEAPAADDLVCVGCDFIPYHAVVNPTQSGARNKEQRDKSRRLGLQD